MQAFRQAGLRHREPGGVGFCQCCRSLDLVAISITVRFRPKILERRKSSSSMPGSQSPIRAKAKQAMTFRFGRDSATAGHVELSR